MPPKTSVAGTVSRKFFMRRSVSSINGRVGLEENHIWRSLLDSRQKFLFPQIQRYSIDDPDSEPFLLQDSGSVSTGTFAS